MASEPPISLNPLKRVNSILTLVEAVEEVGLFTGKSQSPQTGQFNSYHKESRLPPPTLFFCLNPLKRVNSILTLKEGPNYMKMGGIVSIPSNGSIQFLHASVNSALKILKGHCLNPLKRVNSILTLFMLICI